MLLAVFLIGCNESQEKEGEKAQAVTVATTEVRIGTMRETVQGIGTLKSVETVEIRPELAGTVESVAFTEGVRIAEGDLLYQLDDDELREQKQAAEAAQSAAEAQLKNAKWQFDRIKGLRQQDVASPEEYKELRDQVDQFEASVQETGNEIERIQERLEEMRITAPMDGMIGETHVDEGDFVDIGDHLATLYSISPLEAAFTLPERVVGHIEDGQAVEVITDAYPNHGFRGKVSFVSPAVREQTRDLLVKADVPNEAYRLKPGMFITSKVTLEVHDQALIVPEATLVQTRKGYQLFVIRDGTARKRSVQIGLRKPGEVEIRTGVEAGEEVVVRGQMRLRDGDRVTIEQPQTSPATQPATRGTS
jgi:membrane fusion protein (multidrug efflux system)